MILRQPTTQGPACPCSLLLLDSRVALGHLGCQLAGGIPKMATAPQQSENTD